MNVFITGATGLIGTALIKRLLNEKHQITALTRSPKRALAHFDKQLCKENGKENNIQCISNLEYLANLNSYDAIINLAGEPIADKRWSALQKHRLEQSRWQTTQQLADLIAHSASPPSVFISGSAIGYYGRVTEEPAPVITESFPTGERDYSHRLCDQWEKCALHASSDNTRVCLLRTGIVLAKNGGAMEKLLPQFQFGLGGKIGDGKHYMSWIHIEDMVGAIVHLLNQPNCHGAFNVTAPQPVSNREFARTLGEVLHRPSQFTTPKILLKLMFGEMADILIYGHNIVPEALLNSGYHFKFDNLESGLVNLFG